MKPLRTVMTENGTELVYREDGSLKSCTSREYREAMAKLIECGGLFDTLPPRVAHLKLTKGNWKP